MKSPFFVLDSMLERDSEEFRSSINWEAPIFGFAVGLSKPKVFQKACDSVIKPFGVLAALWPKLSRLAKAPPDSLTIGDFDNL